MADRRPARRPDDQVPVDDAGRVTVTNCSFGPRVVDPSLERQAVAGEEDQSVPGWDFGP